MLKSRHRHRGDRQPTHYAVALRYRFRFTVHAYGGG
jgi:hypothetical protein